MKTGRIALYMRGRIMPPFDLDDPTPTPESDRLKLPDWRRRGRCVTVGTLVVLSFVTIAAAVPAVARAETTVVPRACGDDDRAATQGLHGMVLFGGRDGLWVSHLPLFIDPPRFVHPHDRQVYVEVAFADPALDKMMRAKLAAKPALWTVKPESFQLVCLTLGNPLQLKQFNADIFEGHFERDGIERQTGVTVKVVRVIENHRIDSKKGPGTRARYLPIGRGDSMFLVKQVEARPDFDHIVALRPGAVVDPAGFTLKFTLNTANPHPPSVAALQTAGKGRFKVAGTVHFETADLKAADLE